MSFIKITESESLYRDLEQKSTLEILTIINNEDQKVAMAVQHAVAEISTLIDQLLPRFLSGGRLFYIGAGTSGRLGILDASEIPPTFGLDHNRVIGLIAGGDTAIRKAVEFAEDQTDAAWTDLSRFNPNPLDTLIGIAASGTTPYVIGGVRAARKAGLLTASISCNPDESTF